MVAMMDELNTFIGVHALSFSPDKAVILSALTIPEPELIAKFMLNQQKKFVVKTHVLQRTA